MAEVVRPAREVFIVPGEDALLKDHDNVAVDPAVVRVLEPVPKRVAYRVETRKLPNQYDEVFVIADSPSDARFVDNRLNDQEARDIKSRRLAHVREQGEVNEVLMPDTLADIELAIWLNEGEKRRAAIRERMKDVLPRPETKSFTVSALDLEVDGLEVKLSKGCTEGYIKLNGEKVTGVQTLTVECSVHDHPKVTMTLIPDRKGEPAA